MTIVIRTDDGTACCPLTLGEEEVCVVESAGLDACECACAVDDPDWALAKSDFTSYYSGEGYTIYTAGTFTPIWFETPDDCTYYPVQVAFISNVPMQAYRWYTDNCSSPDEVDAGGGQSIGYCSDSGGYVSCYIEGEQQENWTEPCYCDCTGDRPGLGEECYSVPGCVEGYVWETYSYTYCTNIHNGSTAASGCAEGCDPDLPKYQAGEAWAEGFTCYDPEAAEECALQQPPGYVFVDSPLSEQYAHPTADWLIAIRYD